MSSGLTKEEEGKLRHLRPATVESCHRCKNRKEYWIGCPVVEAHRYCKGCVERHFSLDYETASTLSPRLWHEGCPICTLSCLCASCRRKKRSLDGASPPPLPKRRRTDARTDGDAKPEDDSSDNSKHSASDNDEDDEYTTEHDDAHFTHASSRRKVSTRERKDLENTLVIERPLRSRRASLTGMRSSSPQESSVSSLSSSPQGFSSSSGDEAAAFKTESPLEPAVLADSCTSVLDGVSSLSAHRSVAPSNSLPTTPLRPRVGGDSVTPLRSKRDYRSKKQPVNGSKPQVRRENGHYVLEHGCDVEALVGLTGAGSVLSRRYTGPSTTTK